MSNKSEPTKVETRPSDYLRGICTGRLEVINAVRSLLEESEQRISILSILATLERLEQEILEATK